jgi:hypothetical protein
MAANKKAPAGKNLPMSYDEQLAKEAAAIQSRIQAPAGDRVRYNANKSFQTPDGAEGETLQVVVLDFLSTNMFYDRPFNKDNPMPPACFAIGSEPSLLVPSDNSPDKQSDSCTGCPMNQFGSASSGSGKACKNTRLVAVSPLAGDGEDPADMPIWIMQIPPASLKAFDGYVRALASKHQSVPVRFLTEVSMDSNETFAAPRFAVVRPLDNDELGAVMGLREQARERLLVEPDVSTYEAPKPVAVRRR